MNSQYGCQISSRVINNPIYSCVYFFQIRIHVALPYSIFGVICLQAAVLGLFLPETKGAPTLETMDDMKTRNGMALHVISNDKQTRAET
jgi:hypothetical protein